MPDHVPLPGSERAAATGAQRLRDADPTERGQATVTLSGPPLPEAGAGEPLTRQQLERDYGADAQTITTVTEVLGRYGLTVEESSPLTRSLRVSGTVAQFEQAFRPALSIYRHPDQGEFRGRDGQLQIPAELEGLVTGVFGLDERRVARRRGVLPQAQAASAPALSPAQLASHYAFPAGDGSGQTVAIAEFGGGYFADDLRAFCAKQGTPVPQVSTVSVNGAQILTLAQIQQLPQQQQQQELDDSVEVNMDVQIVAGLAPGADQIVYFSTFDEQGWVDLLGELVAGKPAPVVALSVSWGLAEDDPDWSQGALQAIDQRLAAAAALGITVCVSSGDDGSSDAESDGRAHLDFPASSPHTLAVGGTMLSGDTDIVWWESPGYRTGSGGGSTGGGVSAIFPRPSWQDVQISSINPGSIDGRAVPDIAALAGPPFYDVIFMGQDQPNGGTSASTPLWAALVARMAAAPQRAWKAQFLTPLLYAPAASGGQTVGAAGCTDVTSGNNVASTLGKGYSAGPGFDAVSGWGVPNGTALLSVLTKSGPGAKA